MNTTSETLHDGNGNGPSAVSAVPHRVTGADRPGAGMGWKLSVTVIVLALGLGIGFYLVHHHRADERSQLNARANQAADTPPTVDTVAVHPAAASQALALPGETRGWYQSTIYARVDGYVEKWSADIGDKVRKGQVLATINTPDLDAQLQSALQQLAVAKSGVTVAQANTAFAKTTYERWRDSPKGVVAPQETDEKKATYDSSVAELQASQARVSAAAADVDRIRALESYKQVTAPFDGIITMRRIDIGNLVTAGSTSNTSPLYDMAQTDVMRVFVDVPQDLSGQIAIGMPGQVTSGSFPGRVFLGKVARTSRAIDLATRTLKVEVDIPNRGLALLPGMYVQVSFAVHHGALLEVPASALLFRVVGPQVAVIDNAGTIHFHNVKIAIDNGSTVDVSSGVANADRVALNLSSQIADGEHVNVAHAQ